MKHLEGQPLIRRATAFSSSEINTATDKSKFVFERVARLVALESVKKKSRQRSNKIKESQDQIRPGRLRG